MVVVPSPTCPSRLRPQQATAPELRRAHVSYEPAEIPIASVRPATGAVVVGTVAQLDSVRMDGRLALWCQ